jgi:hypothetical protein
MTEKKPRKPLKDFRFKDLLSKDANYQIGKLDEQMRITKIINELRKESIKCGKEHDCSQEVELQCYWEDSGAIGILENLKGCATND